MIAGGGGGGGGVRANRQWCTHIIYKGATQYIASVGACQCGGHASVGGGHASVGGVRANHQL